MFLFLRKSQRSDRQCLEKTVCPLNNRSTRFWWWSTSEAYLQAVGGGEGSGGDGEMKAIETGLSVATSDCEP